MRVNGVRCFAAVATIGALALGGGSRIRALALWPALFLGTLSIAPFSRIYMTEDRNGTVAIRRLGLGQYVVALLAAPILLIAVFAVTALVNLVFPVGAIYVPLVAGGILFILSLWILAGLVVSLRGRQRGASLHETGPETPKGRRFAISNLAQRPGTYWTALTLAQQVIEQLPRGSVLCAVASDEKLAAVYVRRGGFTAGRRMRVYRVIS
ncbi:hypothetical protein [Microbacterium nymphoidis]|uniref:hypothetical protein n=1 Tax=Microbacterium nymphoidis TaxID=2898586 RepID=UPI001E33940C|nr:hypothetical protein [Microbacterium nymphoidis]MCD2498511.1 hypothetical protein [Microbacterium nymphoidis]